MSYQHFIVILISFNNFNIWTMYSNCKQLFRRKKVLYAIGIFGKIGRVFLFIFSYKKFVLIWEQVLYLSYIMILFLEMIKILSSENIDVRK